MRQLDVQPVHATADVNSSAAALTQGRGLTHMLRGQRCSGRDESPPLVIRATEPILMGCCVGETVLHCMCARECPVHERVRCRQLPGGGPGPLPSAALWIREKPPVILASLQAHPN